MVPELARGLPKNLARRFVFVTCTSTVAGSVIVRLWDLGPDWMPGRGTETSQVAAQKEAK